jgi:hypothetical protein
VRTGQIEFANRCLSRKQARYSERIAHRCIVFKWFEVALSENQMPRFVGKVRKEFVDLRNEGRFAIRAAKFGPETDAIPGKTEGVLKEQQECSCVPSCYFSMT